MNIYSSLNLLWATQSDCLINFMGSICCQYLSLNLPNLYTLKAFELSLIYKWYTWNGDSPWVFRCNCWSLSVCSIPFPISLPSLCIFKRWILGFDSLSYSSSNIFFFFLVIICQYSLIGSDIMYSNLHHSLLTFNRDTP